jgi:hypothetical protein
MVTDVGEELSRETLETWLKRLQPLHGKALRMIF